MKIEIEFNNSYEANITLDGKRFKYGYKYGYWSYSDEITTDELEKTIGGIVIQNLCDDLSSILQNWMPEEESPDDDCWETWEILPEHIVDELEDIIW